MGICESLVGQPNVVSDTYKLLHEISHHLNRRSACNGDAYRLSIGTFDPENPVCKELVQRDFNSWDRCIYFDAGVWVKDHEPDTLQLPVIQHIITYHIPHVYDGFAIGGCVKIKPNSLVPGIYEFSKYYGGKHRRWHKMK